MPRIGMRKRKPVSINVFSSASRSGAMVGGSLLAMGLGFAGVGVVDQLLMSAAMCLISAWLAVKLHRACD